MKSVKSIVCTLRRVSSPLLQLNFYDRSEESVALENLRALENALRELGVNYTYYTMYTIHIKSVALENALRGLGVLLMVTSSHARRKHSL